MKMIKIIKNIWHKRQNERLVDIKKIDDNINETLATIAEINILLQQHKEIQERKDHQDHTDKQKINK